jgi:hypothetical protein
MPEARVLRPATVELRFPTRIALATACQGEHGPALHAELKKQLDAVPARLVSVDAGASLALACGIASPTPNEVTQNTETTCTDNSGAGPVRYACVLSKRRVEVSIEVSLVLTEQGRELFRTSLPLKTQQSTDASIAKESVPLGQTPAAPPIDVGKLQTGLVASAASRLIKWVAPYTDVLGKARSNCGPACEDAWKLLGACDYRGADDEFRQAASSVEDPTQRSAALWGRAISHELVGQFDQAQAFLEEGQKLAPLHSEFAAELAGLSEQRALAVRLEKQGLTRYNACSR